MNLAVSLFCTAILFAVFYVCPNPLMLLAVILIGLWLAK
jgi:hypothetical protein